MDHNFKSQAKGLLLIGFVGTVFVWIAVAHIDARFETGGVLQKLLSPDPHALSVRLTVIGILAAIFLIFLVMFANRNRLQQALEDAMMRSEVEKARSEAILAELGDGISIQDTEFKILYQNRALISMMGAHPGEFCYAAYHGRESICEDCHLAASFADGETHFREGSKISDRGKLHVEIISTPLRNADGKIVAGIEAVRDATERKHAEEKIIMLNNELERQAAELRAANRELEAFGYSVSHDLRTPLTRIYAGSQAMRDMYWTQLDENGRFFIDSISSGAEKIEELIEAMLLLSQVTKGELYVEEVDLSRLAGEVFSNLRLAEPDREVKFTLNPALMVWGDRKLLQVAVENMLGNAWKYTRKSGTARVEVGMEERDGEKVYFVRDSGVGFAMKDADKLFKPFQRLHKAAEFAGTGIGLVTVQRIVERHGGRIWGEGEEGRGATFYFTIKEDTR